MQPAHLVALIRTALTDSEQTITNTTNCPDDRFGPLRAASDIL